MGRALPHYDMAPVLASGVSLRDLESLTGITRRTLERWRKAGVPYWSADRLAVGLGTVPDLLWPRWTQAPEELAG